MGQSPCFGGNIAGLVNASGNQPGAQAGNNPRQISLRRIRDATDNFAFNHRIGEGGTSTVFSGTINNQVVAIKRLTDGEDRNADYDRELAVLSRLEHINIIKLIGYCAQGEAERIIVYEFMPLGNLHDKLHARPAAEEPLDWAARMRIAAGVARGLSYLHNDANPRVIYRDLRPTNVLLGPGNLPKISDFGIAISEVPPGQPPTVITTALMGTHPYIAPESTLADRLSSKSDVYSFGVLLLEIIAGTVPLDQRFPRYVAAQVRDPETFLQRADPELNGQFPEAELVKAMSVVVQCIKIRPTLRPNMIDVVRGMNNLAGEPGAEWPAEFDVAAV